MPVKGFPEVVWAKGYVQPTTFSRQQGHVYRTKYKKANELN